MTTRLMSAESMKRFYLMLLRDIEEATKQKKEIEMFFKKNFNMDLIEIIKNGEIK